MESNISSHSEALNVQAGMRVQTNFRAGDAVDDFATNVLGWDIESMPDYLGYGGMKEVAEAWFNNTSPNPI